MQDWERTLREALAQTPPWPGNVEALWHRVARRIRRPRARLPWQPVAAVAAAAAALALVWRAAVPPAPRGGRRTWPSRPNSSPRRRRVAPCSSWWT